ncbi:MAG TPA: serine hydrolase domain-containing protein [Sphingomonas sp.]|nr:serine hydrolase domain-containing protein [Sphingomonas sp.]
MTMLAEAERARVAAGSGMAPEPLARIRPALQRYIDEGVIPCAQTVIYRHGEIVFEETQGWSSVEARTPLRPDAIFRLYSMTKPLVGVAILLLLQDGRLRLDDPVAAYLPEFADMKVLQHGELVPADRPITLHHLLTHTAGLSYHFLLDDPVAEQYFAAGLFDNWTVQQTGISLADYVERLASFPLRAQPGTAWCYSEAMNVLGRVVEVVSGKRFGAFLQDRIIAPLGMVDTGFHVRPDNKGRLVDVYQAGPEGGLSCISDDLGFDFPPSADLGGSGLVGTAADYLRFARMLLNGGELDGVRILNADIFKLLVTNHLGPEFGERPLRAMPQGLYAERGVGHGYCGVVIEDPVVRGVAGSPGEYSWAGAADTNFWIDFEEDLIVIVLSQVFPGESQAREIHGVVRELVYESIQGGAA